MNRLLVFLWLTVVCWTHMSAQDDPEYKAEIGAGVGLVAYQGDLSGSLTAHMQPLYTLMGKYRMNPRMSWAVNVSFGKLKGSSDKVKTWYPDLHDATYSFSNALVDASIRFEYNFWPYGTGREYRGAQPLTPFIAGGFGITHSSTAGGGVMATNVPLGLGVKYKMTDRLNLALEWMVHFTLSDRIDGVNDPYGIKSNGLFKNTDCYSALQMTVSYDIWAKCKTCNNDDF